MCGVNKFLRQRRLQLDLTIYEVGERIGVSGNYISLIERGKNVPSDDVIKEIAKLYNLDEDFLFEQYGKISPSVQEEIHENKNLRETIAHINRNEAMTEEKKKKLYNILAYWYKRIEQEEEK